MAAVADNPSTPPPPAGPPAPALLVAHPSSADDAARLLESAGYGCEPADHPYAAMLELVRRPMAFRALAVSLPALYRPELALLSAVARRLPHVRRFVCHADGRAASLAEALRLGATAVLDAEGLHEVAPPPVPPPAPAPPPAGDEGSPVLTSEELRALLNDS